MNHNQPFDEQHDFPMWAEEILVRRELWDRADEPLAAVIVLPTDAADHVKAASLKAFEDQALSSCYAGRRPQALNTLLEQRTGRNRHQERGRVATLVSGS